MRVSKHAAERMQQRHITDADLEDVVAFGRRIFRTGVEIIFLGRRDVPLGRERAMERLVGTVVLVSRDAVVVTVYRNQKALRDIKRKLKRFEEPGAAWGPRRGTRSALAA